MSTLINIDAYQSMLNNAERLDARLYDEAGRLSTRDRAAIHYEIASALRAAAFETRTGTTNIWIEARERLEKRAKDNEIRAHNCDAMVARMEEQLTRDTQALARIYRKTVNWLNACHTAHLTGDESVLNLRKMPSKNSKYRGYELSRSIGREIGATFAAGEEGTILEWLAVLRLRGVRNLPVWYKAEQKVAQ